MTSYKPSDSRQDDAKYNRQNNPGAQTSIPTTEEGDTRVDETYRMTGQQSGSDVSPGSEPEAPGAAPKVVGSPNQGTDSR